MKKIVFVTLLAFVFASIAWVLFSQRAKKFDPLAHEVRQLSFWQKSQFAKLPLEDRILEIPDELLDYVNRDNKSAGWPNRPVRASLTEENRNLLKEVLRELPDSIKAKASPLLVGIFFVQDLGGTAYTEYIVDASGNPVAGFILFDELILKKRANEWATWKEKSPFLMDDPTWDLQVIIEDGANDSVKSAFQFIALHELGHLISIPSGMHPLWGSPASLDRHPNKYEFSKLSWTLEGNKAISLFESVFPLRNQIHFYRDASTAPLLDVYSQLEKTNFPTLYAATSVSDDFADSFASFVHVVLLKRPYEVFIFNFGVPVKKISSCWGQDRCREKEAVLRKFLGLGE